MKRMDRREFLKTLGLAGAAATGTSLVSCGSNSGTAETYDPNGTETGEIPTDKMEYRQFPNLGKDKVSLLGYGCMRWPMIANPNGEGEIIDQEQVNKLVDYAIAHGVNYFDTSPVYCQGLSEKATGIALARHPRESYYVATKASNFYNSEFDNSVLMYKKSLEYLQTDYLDFYLLHSIGSGGQAAFEDRFLKNGLYKYLDQERQAGRIRHLGFSFHGSPEDWDYLMKLHDTGECKWDFVQIQMNYCDWKYGAGENSPAEYLYNDLVKRNLPAVIMEPLLGGRLSKLPNNVVGILKQKEPEKSAASWAFRWLGTFPQILTVLSGMTYMEHLQDNLRSFCPYKKLTDEEMKFLADTAKVIMQYPTIPCNDCKYCMPCPYGLDIPAILTHYNKFVNEGAIPEDMQNPEYRKMRHNFLVSYDRNIPKIRQASHCTGCRKCVEHCPQKINIPQMIQRIDRFVEDLKQDQLGIRTENPIYE